MARSAAKTSALVASTIVFTLGAHAFPRGDTAHNPDNPNRHLLARAITADTSKLDGKTFDFVIVGGGTAGLAMASRLTEYSNMTVAVIEAGGDGSDHADNINIPGYSYLHGLTGSDADWSYTITNQSSAGNRATKWPRGKVLGGSGSTNGMFWGIGSAHDWDAWSTLFPTSSPSYNSSKLPNGTPASFPWTWTQIQHYHKKSETFHAPPAEQQSKYGMMIDADAHGTSGPIQTTMSEFIYDPVSNWVPTLVNVGMKKGDLASGDTNVATITPSTLNPSNFTRSNSLAGYITPVGPRSNLVILTGVQATGLVWGSKKNGGAVATGVNFAASAGGQTYSVKASKEVILCGGVIGSAQLLQVSGVGPKALMDSLKIQSVVDLPGVGQNLQDHEATTVTWSVDGATWADLAGNATLQAEQLVEFRESSTGLWTYINEAVAYPNIQNIMGTSADTWISSVSSQLSSALSSLSTAQSLDSTVLKGITQQFNIQLDMLKNGVGQLEIIMTMLAGAGNVGIQVAQQHAWSRGELRISSASIWDYPTINPNYLSNGWDVDIMNAGIKFVRRVGSTEPMSSYLKTEGGGTSAATTDAAINSYVANSIATGYHPIGTCSMLPLDMGGVVDTTLRVYGTTNVRVIDASVMPIHVTAHTMAPAYAIAEYGADIIKMAYWPVPPSASTTSSKAGGPSGTPDTETGVATGGLSQTQRTAAIAASIGGAAAVAALIAVLFFIRKRGKKANAQEDAYSGAYATDQRRSDLPMQTLSQSDLNAPIAPFKTGGKPDYRMSASTMDTAQLHAATPMQEHQHLHYDDPHSPGYAYGSQTFNPYTDASAPGTPYMGPAPGLNPGNPHEYQYVSGRASPGSNTGARI
ncbi:GMC oxidoreductase [Rhizoctonia solani]|uniref:GMC oxidoreductase n=1 Tax=Rhizoctonia solani TaxID=456999 RepID=A0A8H8P4A5_9AGAM|nr:GMC oxidoreductase [Rhizoctonia solani]QRW24890.1 GMC oxidoreductase [Rhizoctonia solani]